MSDFTTAHAIDSQLSEAKDEARSIRRRFASTLKIIGKNGSVKAKHFKAAKAKLKRSVRVVVCVRATERAEFFWLEHPPAPTNKAAVLEYPMDCFVTVHLSVRANVLIHHHEIHNPRLTPARVVGSRGPACTCTQRNEGVPKWSGEVDSAGLLYSTSQQVRVAGRVA